MAIMGKILFGGMGLILMVTLAFAAFDLPEGNQVVDCYDRYGNEIIGERCIEEGTTIGERAMVVTLGFFMFVALLLAGHFMDSIGEVGIL